MGLFQLSKETSKNTPTLLMPLVLSGNLCRCTGYRPILESGKTFCMVSSDHGDTLQSKNGSDRWSRLGIEELTF